MTFIIALPRELLFNIRLGEVSGKVSFCQATFPASPWEAQSSEVSAGCVALYPQGSEQPHPGLPILSPCPDGTAEVWNCDCLPHRDPEILHGM